MPKRCGLKLLPAACQSGSVQNCYKQLAQKVHSQTVTNSLPDRFAPKLLPTACQKGAVQKCYQQLAKKVQSQNVTNSFPDRFGPKLLPTVAKKVRSKIVTNSLPKRCSPKRLPRARLSPVVRLTRSLIDPELFPHTAYVKIFATLARKAVNQGCQQKATH